MTNNNDFIIDNNTGQQVRIDIQEALQQLASNNFGTNPPAVDNSGRGGPHCLIYEKQA